MNIIYFRQQVTETLDGFNLYFIYTKDSNSVLTKRFSRDGIIWRREEECTIIGKPAGEILWHLDVLRLDSVVLGLFVFCKKPGGSGSELYWGVSEDEGFNWTIMDKLKVHESQNEIFINVYRGSLVYIKTSPPKFELYYSAQVTNGSWWIYYMPDAIKWEDLRV